MKSTNSLRLRLLYCIAVLAATNLVFSQDQWRIIADYRDVRDMHYVDNIIWAATSGGLISFDLTDFEFTKYSLKDGLDGIGIQTMIADDDGGLWLAYENNTLQRFKSGQGLTDKIWFSSESGITRVNQMNISPHGLFLATNRGIARVKYVAEFDRWVMFDEYNLIGDFPTNQPVNCVQVVGDYVWAGTDLGIARGDMNSPSPLDWVNYTTEDGLFNNEIIDIEYFVDKVLAVTSGGIGMWTGDMWEEFSSTTDVKSIFVINDSLRAIRSRGAYTWIEGRWNLNTPLRRWIKSAVWDDDNRVWLGMMFDAHPVFRGGIFTEADSGFVEYLPNGPATNIVLEFSFSNQGEALMVGGYGAGHYGLSIWNGISWSILTSPDYQETVFNKQTRCVQADLDGGVWFGSWGGGLAHYSAQNTIINYDWNENTGARLTGFGAVFQTPQGPDSSQFKSILLPDITTDFKGNVWLLNRGARNGSILVCIPRDFVQEPDLDKDWIYFPLPVFSRYPHFDRLAADDNNRIWFASTSNLLDDVQGIYALDHKGTLDNFDDDVLHGPFAELGSPQILDLSWDPDGYIWAGSIDGAYYINTNVQNIESQTFISLYPLDGNQVNVVTVDPSGNKWFATTLGVKIVANDLFTVKREITNELPDRLPSLNVISLGINPATGIAYIGTDQGTVTLDTPYRDYGDVIEGISIEPNPFNPNLGRMEFTGTSLANFAKVGIYTPDGRLVRKMDHEEAAFGWDGYTDNGHKTASGVYIIVAHTDTGDSKREKVAVVWK